MSLHKRSSMTLFSGHNDLFSHRVRIAMTEKAVAVDVIHIDPQDPPEDLLDVNPYGNLPTLIDRDLVLNQSNIIMEYLDERFPHPPLLPVYPVVRAKSRLMIHRIEQDWYTLATIIETGSEAEADKARNDLRDQLVKLVPVFSEMPFFLSHEFTLVDCCIAPLLWRLPKSGIDLPESAAPIQEYAKRLFQRDAFQVSLTEHELEIQE